MRIVVLAGGLSTERDVSIDVYKRQDIDGLYDDNPRTNPNANKIDVVGRISPEIFEMAAGTGSNRGTGGMITKPVSYTQLRQPLQIPIRQSYPHHYRHCRRHRCFAYLCQVYLQGGIAVSYTHLRHI